MDRAVADAGLAACPPPPPGLPGGPPRPGLPAGPYLVVGTGRAGLAAAGALAERFGATRVLIFDEFAPAVDEPKLRELLRLGVQMHAGRDASDVLVGPRRPGCVVKSPGIPPWSPLVVQAQRLGIPVIDELEAGWRIGRTPLVAVTGTNGKTTTAALIEAAARAAGLAALHVGNGESSPPLSAVATTELDCAVCEVSSYQLEASPELLPSAAVLTNLSPEHLARHGSLEAYFACKARLFMRGDRAVPLAVLCSDEAFGRDLARRVAARGGRVVTFGRGDGCDYRLTGCDWDLRSGRVDAITPDGPLYLPTRLPGVHNALNVLAALALCGAIGLDPAMTRRAVSRMPGVPGRLEVIDEGQPFDVIVDLAVSPAAMEAILRTARHVAARRGGRVHAMIGPTGTAKAGLRTAIGDVAGRLADRVTVTAGDDTTLDPAEVAIPEIHTGALNGGRADVEVVMPRGAGIRRALEGADPGDVVLLLGYGPYTELFRSFGVPRPRHDDRLAAREALRAMGFSLTPSSGGGRGRAGPRDGRPGGRGGKP